jgi:hypothetical protein
VNFVVSFFFTMIGITYVYPAEIFQLEPAPAGTPFTNWALGLIIAQVSPISLADIGFEYFRVFFAFNGIAIICYVIVYPGDQGQDPRADGSNFSVIKRYLMRSRTRRPQLRYWLRSSPSASMLKRGSELPGCLSWRQRPLNAADM